MAYLHKGVVQSECTEWPRETGNSARARKKRASCPLHPLYLIFRQAVSCKEFRLELEEDR